MSIKTMICRTHAEAATYISRNENTHVLGGGTLLMRAVNEADPAVSTLVQVQEIQNLGIQVEGDRLIIGAATTMSALLLSHDSAFLHSAARLIGGPAIRNMATVAGNLFAPSPYGDMATALLALDAEVLVATTGQWIPLQQLLAERQNRVPHVVVQIRCKRPRSPAEFRFLKVSRVKPKGISVLAIAVHLPGVGSGGGVLRDVRVAYGAMAATPVRISSVEQCLEGRTLDESTIAVAMSCASEGLAPPTDAIASSWYRQTVAPVHLGRLLRNHANGGH